MGGLRLQLELLASTLLLFSASAPLSGQEVASSQASREVSPVPAAASASAAADTELQQRYPRYIVQREDILAVGFPLSPEFNQTITVQPDGYIQLQNAGSIHVQGMTVPEIEVAIRNAYAGILHEPIVTVDLKDFQKPTFTVTGQVGRPGRYELRSDATVTEAIAVAGGLASTSTTHIYLFHRSSGAWYKVEKLNLKDVMNGKKVSEDSLIHPGDMIVVPENKITKFRRYVPYSANADSYVAANP
jgi:polysaccharide biosynthesis/export protein